MPNIWEALKGYKTYFVAFLVIVLAGVTKLGFIDEPTYEVILGVLASLGLVTLRSGITSEVKKITEKEEPVATPETPVANG